LVLAAAEDTLPVTAGVHVGVAGADEEASQRRWPASLSLDFQYAESRTWMRRQHRGPLMVQRPFYPDGATCHAVVLHPPAGIAGGDHLQVNAVCHRDASAVITTPGANRYYGSDGRAASQSQSIDIRGGCVEWFPQETIFFDRCIARQKLDIHLNQQSRFIGWDINCFGRIVGDAPFVTGTVDTRLSLYLDSMPLLCERLVVEGAAGVNAMTSLRGCTVSGTLLAVAPELEHEYWLELTREVLPEVGFAATQLDGVLIIRYLGNSAEAARQGFIGVWQAIRPLIMQKQAVLPRIWNT